MSASPYIDPRGSKIRALFPSLANTPIIGRPICSGFILLYLLLSSSSFLLNSSLICFSSASEARRSLQPHI
jgi:hypothetical protein